MKKVKNIINATNDIVSVDIDKHKKDDFINYIKTKKEQENREKALSNNKTYMDYVDSSTFNIKQGFEIGNGISGIDPDNTKIIQKLQKNIVCIDSKFRDKTLYPNSNFFRTFLGKNFKNVVKIRLASTQIPNIEEIIKDEPTDLQNNIISWQNQEDYTSGIRTECPFQYDTVNTKLIITITNHNLEVNSNVVLYYFDSSISSLIDLEGFRESFVIDENTVEVPFTSISNFSGTINVDLGVPVYEVAITPGAYDSTKLGEELITQMNKVLRSNGEPHYFTVSVNNKTDIFEFKNFNIRKLDLSPISTSSGSNIITVTALEHGILENEEILIDGSINVGGISSNFINGIYRVFNVTLDTFQYQVNSRASINATSGGNSVIIGRYMPFRFLFNSSNTLLQFNIGFPDEDSSEYIGSENPIETFKIPIKNIYTNVPEGFTTIETVSEHYLLGANIVNISNITINAIPIRITTSSSHNINSDTNVFIKLPNATPKLENKLIQVRPETKNTLLVLNPEFIISSVSNYTNAIIFKYNNKINIYDLIASSENNEQYIYGKGLDVYSVLSSTKFTIPGVYDYLEESSISSSSIGITKIKITHPNNDFNTFTQFINNNELPIYPIPGTSTNFYSVGSKFLLDSDNFNNKYKTNCILVENDPILANSSRNILAITSPSLGVVRIQLTSEYYYVIGEKITISGTNALDGEWTIYDTQPGLPVTPPYDIYSVAYIDILTNIIDFSIVSPPATVTPSFHNTNTIRILYKNHNYQQNKMLKLMDINPLITGLDFIEYTISPISSNSFLIKFDHTLATLDAVVAVLDNENKLEISNTTPNTIKPNSLGSIDFYNTYEIKDITGEIKLGDETYINQITLPSELSNINITSTDDGSIIYVSGTDGYPFFSLSPGIYEYFLADTQNRYMKGTVSSNGSVSFKDVTPNSIFPLNNSDFITITNNNLLPGLSLQNYPITKLSNYSFLINYSHNTKIDDFIAVQFKNEYTGNSYGNMNALVLENDPNFVDDVEIVYIKDVSNSEISNVKEIGLRTPFTYVNGESITINGTTALDGTYNVLTSSFISNELITSDITQRSLPSNYTTKIINKGKEIYIIKQVGPYNVISYSNDYGYSYVDLFPNTDSVIIDFDVSNTNNSNNKTIVLFTWNMSNFISYVIISYDNGSTWETPIDLNSLYNTNYDLGIFRYESICISDNGNNIVVSGTDFLTSYRYIIFKSSNSGLSWTDDTNIVSTLLVPLNSMLEKTKVKCTNSGRIYAVFSNTVEELVIYNGIAWSISTVVRPIYFTYLVRGLSISKNGEIIIFGYGANSDSIPLILVSTDFGQTITVENNPLFNINSFENLKDIYIDESGQYQFIVLYEYFFSQTSRILYKNKNYDDTFRVLSNEAYEINSISISPDANNLAYFNVTGQVFSGGVVYNTNITATEFTGFSQSQLLYIQSTQTDNTFTQIPSITFNNTQSNTIRLVYPANDNQLKPSSIRCSKDGKYIYVIPEDKMGANEYYYSNNFGELWELQEPPDSFVNGFDLSINDTGNLVMLFGNIFTSPTNYSIYRSLDFGANFTQITAISEVIDPGFRKINVSDDGKYQFLSFLVPSNITIRKVVFYISNDFGVTFTKITSISDIYRYDDGNFTNPRAGLSSSGQYITATAQIDDMNGDSVILTSQDYGVNFNIIPFSSSYKLYGIVMSNSGKFQIAYGTHVFFSEDYGVSWNNFDNDNNLWNTALVPIPKPPLITKFSSLFLAGNSKSFYATRQLSSTISDACETSNIIYQWYVQNNELTIEVEPNKHNWYNNDTISIQNNPDIFLNGDYQIISSTQNTLNIVPTVLISPSNPIQFGDIINKSRLHYINTEPITFLSGAELVLVENSYSSPINIDIQSIKLVQNGLIQITLINPSYICAGESITLTGTNSLDGIYSVYIVNGQIPTNIIYLEIPKTETDVSFLLPTPYITPNYNEANTLRIIDNINNSELLNLKVGSQLYILDTGSPPIIPNNTMYYVKDILGDNSFTISYTHAPDSFTDEYPITAQFDSIVLANLYRNQNITLYRVDSATKTNEIGGISLDIINNVQYNIERILDTNSYLINTIGTPSTYAGNYGGNSVYISSILNGIKNAQLNTVDGTELTKLFRSISLEGYNYIYLCTFGKETDLDVIYSNNNSKVNNIFAKILLDQPQGFMCFDSFISTEKNYYTPLPELSELTFAIYTPDGNLYNFNDTDYSIDLEITTIIEEIDQAYLSSNNNTNLRYNQILNEQSSKGESSNSVARSKVRKTKS